MRSFIAISLNAVIKKKLLDLQNRIDVGGAKVRWQTAEQLHLTLKFLGEAPDEQIPIICQIMSSVASQFPPFCLELQDAGCFGPKGPVRVVWAGARDRSGILDLVVQDLEDRLAEEGYPKERRPFAAHLTLGRVKSDPTSGTLRAAILSTPFDRCTQKVTEIVLYQSVLHRGGAEHSPVASAALQAKNP